MVSVVLFQPVVTISQCTQTDIVNTWGREILDVMGSHLAKTHQHVTISNLWGKKKLGTVLPRSLYTLKRFCGYIHGYIHFRCTNWNCQLLNVGLCNVVRRHRLAQQILNVFRAAKMIDSPAKSEFSAKHANIGIGLYWKHLFFFFKYSMQVAPGVAKWCDTGSGCSLLTCKHF